jgi:hypothetical protein
MQTDTHPYSCSQRSAGLLLVFAPKQFFTELSCKPSPVWRHLLSVALAAAVLHYLTASGWGNWFHVIVFFLNAVGMTCIYSGSVFFIARHIFRLPCSFGQVFTVCVYASLGPLFISWIPGALWVSEPWKWWISAIGLSTCIPAGLGRTVMVIALALGAIYILFRILLFIV